MNKEKLRVFSLIFALGLMFQNHPSFGTEIVDYPWERVEDSVLPTEDVNSALPSRVDRIFCSFPYVGATLCFELGYKNQCYYFLAFYSAIGEDSLRPSKEILPYLRVDSNRVADITSFPEVQKLNPGNLTPGATADTVSVWYTQIDSPENLNSYQNGLIWQLKNGQVLNVFVTLQDGSVKQGKISLETIDPLIDQMILAAKIHQGTREPCAPNMKMLNQQ